jgi:fluoride ion exporter CrcB/FEX
MVAMLDGTGAVLGTQIVAALFGYLIGLCSAIASFLFGQHSAEWFYKMHEQNRRRRRNRQHLRPREQQQNLQPQPQQQDVLSPHDEEEQWACVQAVVQDLNAGNSNSSRDKKWHRRFMDFVFGAEGVLAPVLVSGLFAAFVVGDVVYNIPFYRQMWIAAIMSPFGSLLRWRLKLFFNHQPWPCGCRNRSRRVVGSHHSGSGNSDNAAIAAAVAATRKTSSARLSSSVRRVSQSVSHSVMNMPVAFVDWMPWGTFVANMFAVVVSAAAKALLHLHYYNQVVHPWANSIAWAVMTGFAGNLSTVSTFISEICAMKKPSQMHIYAFGSLGVAMVIGLAAYSPIARMP